MREALKIAVTAANGGVDGGDKTEAFEAFETIDCNLTGGTRGSFIEYGILDRKSVV